MYHNVAFGVKLVCSTTWDEMSSSQSVTLNQHIVTTLYIDFHLHHNHAIQPRFAQIYISLWGVIMTVKVLVRDYTYHGRHFPPRHSVPECQCLLPIKCKTKTIIAQMLKMDMHQTTILYLPCHCLVVVEYVIQQPTLARVGEKICECISHISTFIFLQHSDDTGSHTLSKKEGVDWIMFFRREVKASLLSYCHSKGLHQG